MSIILIGYSNKSLKLCSLVIGITAAVVVVVVVITSVASDTDGDGEYEAATRTESVFAVVLIESLPPESFSS